MAISGRDQSGSFPPSVTWSPCGQFVATRTDEVIQIWDPLTFELLSTFWPTKNTFQLIGPSVYSPDGHSIACVSSAGLVVWDVQTGGVIREIQHSGSQGEQAGGIQLVWSLDGGLICIVFMDFQSDTQVVERYNVASGSAHTPIVFQSKSELYLWAHNKSFWIITMDGEGCALNTFEVGHTLTKVESFPIQLGKQKWGLGSFSPTTYHVSLSGDCKLLILDIQKSRSLLDEKEPFYFHSFSSDGGHFAASSGNNNIHIWKYNSGYYIPWRNFLPEYSDQYELLLSPTSPLILGNFEGILKLWYWGGPSVASATHSQQLSIFSLSGTFISTANYEESTVTITNTFSKTPSQYIDTGMEITGLVLIGNVLLVMDLDIAMAWLLTEEGLVDNLLGKRRASWCDAIWGTPLGDSDNVGSLLEGPTWANGPSRNPPSFYGAWDEYWQCCYNYNPDNWYPFLPIFQGWHILHNGFMHIAPLEGGEEQPQFVLKRGGWVTDQEDKHLLWLPIEWETGIVIASEKLQEAVGWFPDGISTLWFESPGHYSIIVKPE